MDAISKDVVTKRLIFVWRNAVQATQNLDETRSKPHKAYLTSKGSFFLSLDGLNAFDQIIDELKKVEEVRLKFSDQYLEKMLNDAIVELLPTAEQEIQLAAWKKVESIFEALATPIVNWTIITPIVGLEIEMNELLIGKVRLFKFKNEDKTKLQSKIEDVYRELSSNNVRIPRELPKTLIVEFDETIEKNFVGKVCAEAMVSAVDNERAEEIGLETIYMTLDALRFYRLNPSFRDSFSVKHHFDVQGNTSAHDNVRTVILFAKTGFSFPKEMVRDLVPFNITRVALDSIKIDNFDVLSMILLRDERDRTDFEKDLITSIRFCALGTHNEQVANAFVNSIISLEALLMKQREAIIDNLAERVAFIIGRDLNERNWFFDEMIRLYRLRCGIVHSGNTDIQHSDLRLIQFINYKCIVNMLGLYQSKKINNVNDLIKWIRNQKFS